MLNKINPTTTKTWSKLINHYSIMKDEKMKSFFENDKNRADKFSIEACNLFLDYSKNIITEKTMELLFELADEINLNDAINQFFEGKAINETENRAVLHTALRNISNKPVYLNNINIMPQIKQTLNQMKDFSENIRSGKWLGYTGKRIRNIVNIGIGGSDLGPVMVSKALKHYGMKNLNVYYVSNIDSTHIVETLKNLNPNETLFMIASKTFTTQETMTNAYTARKWFLDEAKNEDFVKKHFIALSTNEKEVVKFGINKENIFKFWDFVGGRYSLFSAIGLSVMCYIGYENYYEFMSGAYEMDEHFKNTDFNKNLPIILALLGIWYNNFFDAQSEVILPYDQYLDRFAAYFQQGNMESNGKSIDRSGKKINYQTGPIIWGEVGTNGQHAFYQLIHQGTKIIPADFLAPCISLNPTGDHHEKLLSNFFAQTEALMMGKSKEEVLEELINKDLSQNEISRLLPFKVFGGNKPTNSILYKKLTPKILGSLIAMYEHKIFVQGVIWNIYSFDQWGVELGKQLAGKILPELKEDEKVLNHDSSTNKLINKYKEWRRD